MKTFIVVCEAYDRHAPGQITVELHQAVSLERLCAKLVNYDEVVADFKADGDEIDVDAITMLDDMNGDGADSYIIKELVDGQLVDTIIGCEMCDECEE